MIRQLAVGIAFVVLVALLLRWKRRREQEATDDIFRKAAQRFDVVLPEERMKEHHQVLVR